MFTNNKISGKDTNLYLCHQAILPHKACGNVILFPGSLLSTKNRQAFFETIEL